MNNIAISSMPINLSISFSSVAEKLSEGTKKELQMLGFDISTIKTEAQGQALLKTVKEQKTQKSEQARQTEEESADYSNFKSIILGLLAELGEIRSKLEKLEDLLNALLEKIKKLQKKAEEEKIKDKKLESIKERAEAIQKEYSASQNPASVLSASMNNMAMMNKMALNLN